MLWIKQFKIIKYILNYKKHTFLFSWSGNAKKHSIDTHVLVYSIHLKVSIGTNHLCFVFSLLLPFWTF